jgi:hypothetical protein
MYGIETIRFLNQNAGKSDSGAEVLTSIDSYQKVRAEASSDVFKPTGEGYTEEKHRQQPGFCKANKAHGNDQG